MGVPELMKQDTESRESIVLDTSTNFFVEAGAGSGKTTMLVRRMVAMVEDGIDVSRMCAITFTKAAAGEFYDRFQKMLAERSMAETKKDFERNPGELMNPTNESRENCRKALRNIDLCFMGTIDSFCNMVLSEHPAEARIPSNAAVIPEDEMAEVFTREYSRMLRGRYGDEMQQECHIFDSIMGKDAREAFIAGLKSVMDIRHTEIILPDYGDSLDDAVKEEKADIIAALKVLCAHPEAESARKNADSTQAWENLEEYAYTLNRSWDDDINGISFALPKIKPLRIDLDWWGKNESIMGMHADIFEIGEWRGKPGYYVFSKDVLDKLIAKINNYKAGRCLSFIRKAAMLIADECRKRGELTFFDYLLYLRDMLKKDAERDGKLIRHIYTRHSYFLIDEFQDTNPMQAEIFFYLTAKSPMADWKKCVPRPGSLFIVGDPKQSIYRFRNADVASFLKVKALFAGGVGRVLYLTRNFRSTYKIREWFNSTFSSMLGIETSEQSKFEEIPLEDRPVDDGTFSGVYYYDACTEKKDPEDMQDPAVVTRIIKQLTGNPDYLISRRKGDKIIKEQIVYKDFMLITQKKKVLAGYMKAFIEAGIPFYAEGETLFKNCPALIEIVKIFAAMTAHDDKHALYRALTGRLIGLHRNRIAKCCGMCVKKVVTSADGEAKECTNRFNLKLFADNEDFTAENGFKDAEPVKEALTKLSLLAKHADRMSSAALFYKILNDFRVFEKVGADNLEYVWFALELLRAKELEGEVASLTDGAGFLTELISDQSGLERCLSLKEENNRVHMANIHKVKGLESPIVFLAWPKSTDHAPQRRTEQCDPVPKSWVFKVDRKNKPGSYNSIPYFSSNAFEDEIRAETASVAAEKLRLLYVAATRAKNVLLVSKSNRIKSDGTPADDNPWKPFVDVAEDDFFNLPAGSPGLLKERECIEIKDIYDNPRNYKEDKLTGESDKASYKIIRPSKFKTKAKSASDEGYIEIAEELLENDAEGMNIFGTIKAKGRSDGALIGTMVHHVMEVLISSGNRADTKSLVDETVLEYGYDYPAKETAYKEMLTGVIETVRAGGYAQSNGVPKDILSELMTADEKYCEIPFCYREEENPRYKLWNGVIDVVYRRGDEWHIIDYKTNAESSELDEKYEEQMEAYIKAFKVTTGYDADARIYHIDV